MMLTKKQKNEIRNKSLSDVFFMKIKQVSGTDEPITKAISLTEQAVIEEIEKEISKFQKEQYEKGKNYNWLYTTLTKLRQRIKQKQENEKKCT